MKIPYVNLNKQYLSERKDLLKIIDKTLATGNWVGGDEVIKFEKKIAQICGTRFALALNSGTDVFSEDSGFSNWSTKVCKAYN